MAVPAPRAAARPAPRPAGRPAPRSVQTAHPRNSRREQTRASYVDLEIAARAWSAQQVKAGRVEAGKAAAFWQQHGHDWLDKFKSYFPIAKDVKEGGTTIRTIISELGITGTYYIKKIRGRDHVVFKGFAGARQFLTGTHYGVNHHKILELKITKAGMKAAAREGLIFGILFCTVIDIVDYATNDRATLGQLFGTLGMDIAKGLLATGAAYACAAVGAALMGTAVVAVGPVIIALAVGVGASLLLDWLDSKLGISKKLGELCDKGLAKLEALGRELEGRAVATYHRIEHSQAVRDLSRETHELVNWVGRHLPRLQMWPVRP